ncbi:MAG: RNA polymerase factor sigma-54, partial [Pseudomonadota bacterium]
MKPTLQLKLSQQLRLTPQLQQSIRLLQLSTLELNQEIERIVQENPLLELREDWDTPVTEYSFMSSESHDSPEVKSMPPEMAPSEAETTPEENHEHDFEWPQESLFSDRTYEDDDRETLQIPARPLSLREHLNLQTCLSQISERERRITGLLIDSLDDDGYLLQSLDELMEMLPAELVIRLNDLQG